MKNDDIQEACYGQDNPSHTTITFLNVLLALMIGIDFSLRRLGIKGWDATVNFASSALYQRFSLRKGIGKVGREVGCGSTVPHNLAYHVGKAKGKISPIY